MPKAPATFSQDDEEEKTTIESGWEEEASTTVEQGDVAEKIRSLSGGDALVRTPVRNNTNITSTNGGALDEPTVDDQRANAALSLLTPSVAPARIVVTGGNDKGQELEIRPGKTYTVGRAIDNDFVLTDIAVSRKHFDLRHENGTWIVVDRGSGNGTVVNGGIEDQPFVLMNGDAIEIGNTMFRFDHANQPARARHSVTFDVDEEEPSTVAGKPLREDIPSMPPQMLPPLPRPKTVPPPAPLPRPRAPSSAPPYNGMNGARGSIPPVPSAAPIGQPINHMNMGGPIGVPMASPTAPTVQPMAGMQAMRPMIGHPPPPHQAPTMLDANGMLRPQMLHNNAHEGMPPMHNVMPTTIPGQGPPVAPSQPQLPYGYPNVGDMKPQLGQLQINGHVPRDATSTALVQPVPYGMQPMMPQMYGSAVAQPQPGISKKIKLLLGGALLMVLAAIATIAIIRGSSSSKKPDAKAAPATEPAKQPAKKADAKTEPVKVEPIKVEPVKVETKTDTKVVVESPKKPDDAAKKLEEQKKADEAKRVADEQQRKQKEDEKRIADEAKKRLADEQKKAAEDKRAEKAEEARLKREADAKKAEELRKKKAEEKKKTKKTTASVAPIPDEEEDTTPATNTKTTTKTVDTSAVKSKAEDLYRSKKFNDAAKALRSAASSLGEADARDLRSIAAVYEQVGKAYNVGMGPATPPVEAYDSLVRAQNLDRPIGVFSEDIKGRLATVAPKAAAKYMANKEYESAFKAVRVAEANGGSNTTTSSVREALQNAANDLYTAAMEEKSSNPAAARVKLSRIRGMVDKGSVLGKAEKALRDLPK